MSKELAYRPDIEIYGMRDNPGALKKYKDCTGKEQNSYECACWKTTTREGEDEPEHIKYELCPGCGGKMAWEEFEQVPKDWQVYVGMPHLIYQNHCVGCGLVFRHSGRNTIDTWYGPRVREADESTARTGGR